MVRYLTLLSFFLLGYLSSLHARYLNQQEFLNILGRSHHVESRSTSCPPGLCLSKYDYCGTNETYCGEGCKGGPCYGGLSGGGDNSHRLSSENDRSGNATYYDPGLGACGIVSDGDELVCAVADSDFELAAPNGNPNNNPLCGRYISVTGPKGTIKVKVVDRCGSCKSGSLDLSRPAFNQIGDPDQGHVHIDWHYL